jgi:serine/threonine protein kinase
MKSSQEKFILDQLNAYPVCEIREKYTDKLKEISTPAVRNILNQKFVSGSDMKAVLCLFDTLFLSATKKNRREKGLYNLSTHIQQWVTKMEKLPVKSTEGFVYITDIFSEDIQVVVKVPRLDSGFESMVREYFIGVKSLNKLRYLIPSFVYTLGSFMYPKPTKTGKLCNGGSKKTAFVMYEKIPGDSIQKLLMNKEINFDQWLLIFVQILLGLEVAQREVRFTHFDLHAGNVMVRRKDNFNYTVPLDTTSYHVNDPDLIPVIIDFGFATSYIDGRYIGSFDFARYGMLNFMVQGYDMYKFMIYSIAYANDPSLKQDIMNLFQFYGNDDPYNIVKKGSSGVSNATDKYCRDASFSQVANYTPLMFVEWIWKTYRHKLHPNITVSDRLQYIPVRYSSTIKEYDDIFHYNQEGRDKAIALADECVKLKPSYVMAKYNIKVLENYNKGLQSPELASRIKGMNMYLNTSENLLTIDIAMLEKVFDIKIPSQRKLTEIVDNLFSITIRHANPGDKRKAVQALDILVYQEKLNPYLQFYFTILELDLEDRFTEWIQLFKDSDIYQFYTKNLTQNERAIRWGQTLLASIM